VVARFGIVTLLAAGLACAPAHADDSLTGDDFETAHVNTKEVAHEVHVSMLEPGVATFAITRTFEARSAASPITLRRDFEFPDGVVTGFEFRTDGRWRKGALRRDNPARSEGRPSRRARDGEPWAVLEQIAAGQMEIATPAFRAAGQIQVRYTVWARGEPTRAGHRWVYCPEDDTDQPVAPFKILPAAVGSSMWVRPWSDSPSCSEIESSDPPRTKLSARYGVYRLDARAWSWRVELVAPTSLVPTPASPEPGPVVFVLDASRSQESQGGLATQLAIAEAYLANAPKADVELVLVERGAQRVFGRFVPAADFVRSLPAGFAQRPLGNGSFLDRGAAFATGLLKDAGGPGRVVLFTDGYLRSAFDRKQITATLRRAPPGTVVHIVYPGTWKGEAVEHRIPEGLDEISAALGGASYYVTTGKQPVAGSPSLAALVRRLLVPDRIESLALFDRDGKDAAEWPEFGGLPLVEPQGDQVEAGAVGSWKGNSEKPPPPSLRLSGWVWGKEFTFHLRPDPTMQRQLPRLVAWDAEITACQQSTRLRETALRDGFLAPGLVFWVSGGGVAEVVGRGGIYFDPCGGGLSGRRGVGGVSKRDELPPEIAVAARGCGRSGALPGSLRATIEAYQSEILDVTVEGGDAQQRICVAQALWAFRLPDQFNRNYWKAETYDVVLSPVGGGAGGAPDSGDAGGGGGGAVPARRQR